MLATLVVATVMSRTATLSEVVDQAVKDTLRAFPKVKPEEIGVSVLGLTKLVEADYNGSVPFYPASVVKLFWLAFCHQKLSKQELELTPELERALNDMIRDSSNDATGLVVDMVTGTTGGPELDDAEFRTWSAKRNVANVWLRSIGYTDISVCQKTWGDGPYGRERQSYGAKFENRNSLTPRATAMMIGKIATYQMVSREASEAMLKLLKRQNPQDGKTDDPQATDYIGKHIPKGTELYSKAGWTSTTRHDVAYLKLPNSQQFVLAIYTRNHANEPKIIESLAKPIISWFSALTVW